MLLLIKERLTFFIIFLRCFNTLRETVIKIKSDTRIINCGGFACFKKDRIFLLGAFSEGQSCIISSSNNCHFFNACSSLPGFSKRVWITTFRITWESRFCNGFLITLKITIPSQNFLTWCWKKFPLDLMVLEKCLPRSSLSLNPSLTVTPSLYLHQSSSILLANQSFPFLTNCTATPLKTEAMKSRLWIQSVWSVCVCVRLTHNANWVKSINRCY